jgi:hypothetical protein
VSTTVNTVASATIAIARPAGTAQGDVLVASIAANGQNVISVPSGWLQLAAVTDISNPRLVAFYHVSGATEPTSYTWMLAGAAAASGGIARYSGVDNANPLAAAPRTASSGVAVSSLTVPAVTTAGPDAMIIGASAINSSNATVSITSPSGMAERWDLGGKRHDYADALQPTAGGSGDKTWTFSSGREAAAWIAALKPAN